MAKEIESACATCDHLTTPIGKEPCVRCDGAGQPIGQPKEAVNHPSHYNVGKIEVIDAIEDWKLGFNTGNAVKYIARADHKGKTIEDLKKASWYLKREIDRLTNFKEDK